MKETIKGRNLLIFLDYDGTLTPIVDRPQDAVLETRTVDLLRKLAQKPNCCIFIVSGRALSNVKNLVRLKNIVYVGNHGLEIEGPETIFRAAASPLFPQIAKELDANLRNIPGALVEDKGFTLSVHYRMVEPHNIGRFRKIFFAIINRYLAKEEIRVVEATKTYEIRPPSNWNKGKAVLWLLKHYEASLPTVLKGNIPIYIGDDVTDEDAFLALNQYSPEAITIRSKDEGNTAARYSLKGVPEVLDFLKEISEL